MAKIIGNPTGVLNSETNPAEVKTLIAGSELDIEINGLTLTVGNPTGHTVDLYDITGRHLATSNLSIFNFQFPIPGVYLLRCGSTVKKIVALTY